VSVADALLVVIALAAGAAVGSFCCVVIDRMPHRLDEPNEFGEDWDTLPWSEVLAGASRCSTCGAHVQPVDNIPVVSWLALGGRCRNCGVRYGWYHPVVEALVPVLGVAVVLAVGSTWRLAPLLVAVPASITVAVIDARTLLAPRRIIWPAFAAVVALTVGAAAVNSDWRWISGAAVGAVTLAGPLALAWMISPRSIGFGDLRLAVLLGWVVGLAIAGGPVLDPIFLALCCLVLASLVGIVIGLAGRGRGHPVPFGPALVISAWICVLAAQPVIGWLRPVR